MKTRIHIQSFGRPVLDLTADLSAEDAIKLERAINASNTLLAHVTAVEHSAIPNDAARPWFIGDAEPPPYYRGLLEGETAKEGDLVFSPVSQMWHDLARGFGCQVGKGDRLARKIHS
jgi:hypothetical protein